MSGGMKWALLIILWCCTVLNVYIINLLPVVMTLCSLSTKRLAPKQPGCAYYFSGRWLLFFLPFHFKPFGRKCQNLLFMLLPGTVARNVWFNLTGSPAIHTTETKVFRFSFKQDSDRGQNVLTGVQRLLIDSCLLRQSTIFKKTSLKSCPLCSGKHMITTDAFTANVYQDYIV